MLMRYRPLGRSGLQVSVVGLGCNNFGGRLDQDATTAVVDAGFDHGVTLIDTADTYGNKGGSETMLGVALKGRRDEVVLATKFGSDMAGRYGDDHGARGSRRYIRRAVEGSLTRLQTDHIDLYQYHKPDEITPVEETLAALHELITEGKVRYLGSTNFPSWMVADAAWRARADHRTPYVSEQSELSWLDRAAEAELLPACREYGVGFLPYFPLASGLLTGKYRRGEPAPEGTRYHGQEISDSQYDAVEAVRRFAADRGASVLDVAVGGLAAIDGVCSVIAGATRPEQVAGNVAAGEWVPAPGDLDDLRAALDAA